MIFSEPHQYRHPSLRCEMSRRVTDTVLDQAYNSAHLLSDLVDKIREQVDGEVIQAKTVYAPSGPGYLQLTWVQPLHIPERA